ncbi:hypothetical protein HGA91_02735 [candidate division WWE3 bacterium]|nr:hypothetical protein [candidate division WWE3 bacterium]
MRTSLSLTGSLYNDFQQKNNIVKAFLLISSISVISFFVIAVTFPTSQKITQTIFPKAVSSAAVSASVLNDYAFPRGSAPPYGWYACSRAHPEDGWYTPYWSEHECITNQYTIIQDYPWGLISKNTGAGNAGNYSNSFGSYNFNDGILNYISKNFNRSKQYLFNAGCSANDDGCLDPNLWNKAYEWLKSQGWSDESIAGVYMTDEIFVERQGVIRDAVRKHFPKAIIVHSQNHQTPDWDNGVYDKIDVLVAQSYPYYKWEKVAGTYLTLNRSVPRWKKWGALYPGPEGKPRPQGVITYAALDTYRYCRLSTTTDLAINTPSKKQQRVAHQIVLATLGGAQGVMAYYLGSGAADDPGALGTPCEAGIIDFYPTYVAIWPWIMPGDRTEMPVAILSGLEKSITNRTDYVIGPWDNEPQVRVEYPGVIAYQFKDAQGRPIYIGSSMYDPADTPTGNTARIENIPNGTYEVYGENRTVSVTNGSITDTFLPYGYHIYALVGTFNGSGITPTTTPGATPTTAATPTATLSRTPTPTSTVIGNVRYEIWNDISTQDNALLTDLTNDSRYPNNPSEQSWLSVFDTPKHRDTNFGSRMTGYLRVPASGDYTFYLAADDTAELWLGTNSGRDSARKIAEVKTWVSPYEWTTESAQHSLPITLQTGSIYFIEVIHAESIGEDHASVGWMRPGQSSIEVIPSQYFVPEPSELNADINNDGAVNVFDLGLLAAHYGQTVSSTSDATTKACDINRDWMISIYDLGILVGHYNG